MPPIENMFWRSARAKCIPWMATITPYLFNHRSAK